MLRKTCVNHALLDVLQAISWNSNTPDDSWKELAAGKTNSLGRMLGGMKSLKPLTIFRFISFEVELIIFLWTANSVAHLEGICAPISESCYAILVGSRANHFHLNAAHFRHLVTVIFCKCTTLYFYHIEHVHHTYQQTNGDIIDISRHQLLWPTSS